MGSKATPSIPIIDFTNPELTPSTPHWESVRSQVREAIAEFGCFQALFHRISPSLRTDFFACLKDLFDLPLETKKLESAPDDTRPGHGYTPKNVVWPDYESFGIDSPTFDNSVERFTSTLWPRGNSYFSTTVGSFVKEKSELAEAIRRMILESMGVEKYLEENMSSSKYILRVMKYDGSETSEPHLALPDHVDRNMVTILYQNQIDGLEVQTKDGEWIDAKFPPNSFTVIMGESLNAWTNGRIHTPNHRVMMAGCKTRYSAGLFCQFREGYLVTAPEELVDEKHPLQYKPFDYTEFQKYRQENRNFHVSQGSIRRLRRLVLANEEEIKPYNAMLGATK